MNQNPNGPPPRRPRPPATHPNSIFHHPPSETPPPPSPATRHSSPSHVSRNAGKRMQKIHQVLAAGKYPNTLQLAREHDVGKKTILRDLEWMKTHSNAPIAYDRVRHGFYYAEPFDNFLDVPSISE